jgi:hypothetical protein
MGPRLTTLVRALTHFDGDEGTSYEDLLLTPEVYNNILDGLYYEAR